MKRHRLKRKQRSWRLLLLLSLIGFGLILQVLDILSWPHILHWARGYSHLWWLPIVLILLQTALFAFALPGSLIVWVAAALYSPLSATFLSVCGGALGALAAYGFVQSMATPWRAKIRQHRFYPWLSKHGDFLTLCALRVLPAVPHSLINYSAGLLKIPLIPFFFATVLGFCLKFYLYASTLHYAMAAGTMAELVRLNIIGPLVAIALLLLGGRLFREYWQK